MKIYLQILFSLLCFFLFFPEFHCIIGTRSGTIQTTTGVSKQQNSNNLGNLHSVGHHNQQSTTKSSFNTHQQGNKVSTINGQQNLNSNGKYHKKLNLQNQLNLFGQSDVSNQMAALGHQQFNDKKNSHLAQKITWNQLNQNALNWGSQGLSKLGGDFTILQQGKKYRNSNQNNLNQFQNLLNSQTSNKGNSQDYNGVGTVGNQNARLSFSQNGDISNSANELQNLLSSINIQKTQKIS